MKEINLELLLFITLCFAAARLIYSALSARGAVCLSISVAALPLLRSFLSTSSLLDHGKRRQEEREGEGARERKRGRESKFLSSFADTFVLPAKTFLSRFHRDLSALRRCRVSRQSVAASCRVSHGAEHYSRHSLLCTVCVCARAGLCVSVSVFVRQQVVLSFSWTPLTFCERKTIQWNL